ncbi:MAG: PAS domain S-box-containing protein [Paracoccaceae bacterium]|jgi:PAS domain S-box-containing protein
MPRRDQTAQMTQAGLNLIQQALSIYDNDLRLVLSNRPFKQMFGLPLSLVTPGASFEDTIQFLATSGEYGNVADVSEFVQDRVDQARAFVPHYVERTRSNGRTISVEGSPLPEGGWVTVYTDITSIKRQEKLLRGRSEELSDQLLTHSEQLAQTNRQLEATIAQLEEAKRELTEMEARIRVTTEMTPAHIAHIDLDKRYTYTNRRLANILPGRDNDIVGLHYVEALGPHAGRQIGPRIERALAGEATVLEFTDHDSGKRIRTAFTPDRTEGGDINGVYLLSTDVTEETQARAALAQTHKRELAAQLTSGLAHDFANLLTIILGLQGQLEKFDLPARAVELTEATKAAARRGGTLLDRIAGMSGPRDVALVPCDIASFLDTFTPLAHATLPPGVALNIIHDFADQRLMLDSGSLQDSLLNLVLNAKDAIGNAPGEIKITVAAVRDTWLEFTVQDTGPGFSKEALASGLYPFFSTKGGAGSGLGLSMVYDLIKSSGGHVKLSNTPIGACITLRLPLRPATQEPRQLLILLVEDSAELRASIRDMLIDLGHQVIEAGSAEEGLSLTELPGLDMVLSDIRLSSHMTGVDLLERVSTNQPQLRLALMTSLPITHPLRTRGASRWPVLSKPFEPQTLLHLLATQVAA